MKTCFSIMPFGDSFKDIDRIIRGAARKCDMEYVRGDLSARPGSILPQIVHEIHRAAVVVADITGHNPNVFYELGIAHQIKGPERVVIITQEVDGRRAYDVHQFRQLVYAHSDAGRASLRKALPERLRQATESSSYQEYWSVIRGCLPRTRMLVRDLELLLEQAGSTRTGLRDVTIRIVAGLGSLAISDHEPPAHGSDAEYISALIAERNTLRTALLRGVRLKAVINPPRRFTPRMLPGRLQARYRRLIGLLEGRSDVTGHSESAAADVAAMKQCEFALSPVPMPNVFIIGDRVAYEGMKRGGTGGFEMTHCETSPDRLREMILQFDEFYAESRSEMVRTHPPDGRLAEQLRGFYREAMTVESQTGSGPLSASPA